jgi:NAD(P)-dependent dehydrogenase (short-subunit alcohol dehydrogenase family)
MRCESRGTAARDERTAAMLEGKVCVVTGAGGGIGRATAVEMATRGARAVVAADINLDPARETAALVEMEGAASLPIACDVSSSRDVGDLMASAARSFGRIDVLHNNAGIHETGLTESARLEDLPEDVFDKVVAVNLKGVWLGTKHATPHLREAGGGAIVNASSLSGLVGFDSAGVYCATKAAVILLTKVAALELAPYQIRCNCYCPGAADTAMARGYIAGSPDPVAAEQTLVASHLIPRMADPVEVARLVCFLASDESSFMTGAAVPIDGGATAWRGVRASNQVTEPRGECSSCSS